MLINFYQFIGLAGAFLFIISYFLLSMGKLTAGQPVYQLMNIMGALCLIFNAANLQDMPTLLVNGVWFLIGCGALIRIIRFRLVNDKTKN